MAKTYYVVWNGRQTGIFDNWEVCKRQVNGFADAKYKGFSTLEEAKIAYGGKPSKTAKAKAINTVKDKVRLTAMDVVALEAEVKIFSDGACFPNPGEAGSGIAIYRGNQLAELWYGLYNPAGTNNTAELKGLHHALLAARIDLDRGCTVAVFCDSSYSINCITQWAKGWKKNNWKKNGEDIKNIDLIRPMHDLYEELGRELKIHHVNGHIGIEGNELADRMSALAIETQEVDLKLFMEPLDISEILSMRAG